MKKSQHYSHFCSVGSYLPEKVLTNADLEKILDTSDEWITQRTGIKSRHIAKGGELTSDLGTKAALDCLKQINFPVEKIEAIIVATCTPDKTFPSTANIIQNKLECNNAFSFDIQAACSGFLYALSIGDSFILNKKIQNVLIIGADIMSSLINWQDRGTAILFGDGAGAVLLEAKETNQEEEKASGLIFCNLYCEASLTNILYTDGGIAENQSAGTIVMDGRKVFEAAVKKLTSIIKRDLASNNIIIDQIGHFIMHQANSRMIESIAKKLEIPIEKTVITVGTHGNTSAASIPLALSEIYKQGAIKQGDLILFAAVGAGLTLSVCLFRF